MSLSATSAKNSSEPAEVISARSLLAKRPLVFGDEDQIRAVHVIEQYETLLATDDCSECDGSGKWTCEDCGGLGLIRKDVTQ